MTARGSYCGSSFVVALRTCEPIRSCDDDGDCQDGKGEEERCFENISCTFHASKAVTTGTSTDDDGDDGEGVEEESIQVGNNGNGVEFAAANDFQENSSTVSHLGLERIGCTTTLIVVLLTGVIFLV